MTDETDCQLRLHWRGLGKIEMHVIERDVLICVRCAVGEENIKTAGKQHWYNLPKYGET